MPKDNASNTARNTSACRTETAPDAKGRPRVRSTNRSMSRSNRSFTTQPAPRISTAPTANSNASRTPSATLGAASAKAQNPGSASSQMPIGRSRRISSA